MSGQFKDKRGTPSASMAVPSSNAGLQTIGRLVLTCAIVLLISGAALVGTALQIVASIDRADLEAERQRAATAIDTMTSRDGPLTNDSAMLLGRLAGLRDAHLSTGVTNHPGQQQIPLLNGLGPSGSWLTWTRTSMARHIFVQFAPIRLPIIAGMLLLVVSLLLRIHRLVADIDSQRRLAQSQSRTDLVTGLGNRLAFESALSELVSRPAPFVIVLLDLDRFKDINDAFGHAAGDDVLRAVGARLSRLLAPGDLLARVGGDEFAILTARSSSRDELVALACNCIAAIEAPVQLAVRPVRVGVSLGIATSLPPHAVSASLVAQADAALYRAKAQRGSAFGFAGDTPTLAPPARRRRRAAA